MFTMVESRQMPPYSDTRSIGVPEYLSRLRMRQDGQFAYEADSCAVESMSGSCSIDAAWAFGWGSDAVE